jgi:hypothetical protein
MGHKGDLRIKITVKHLAVVACFILGLLVFLRPSGTASEPERLPEQAPFLYYLNMEKSWQRNNWAKREFEKYNLTPWVKRVEAISPATGTRVFFSLMTNQYPRATDC